MTAQRHKTARQRFDEKWKLDGESKCWNWTGFKSGDGYGFFFFNGKNIRAHAASKAIYSRVNLEQIPDGMEWDHLCRNRGCVNPDHLELVTHRENQLRGFGACGINSRKTHCKYGHPLISGNLVSMENRKHRSCLTCRRRQSREYHYRKMKSECGHVVRQRKAYD